MGKDLKVDFDYLKQMCDYSSTNLVGKICKRFEILDNKDAIKKDAKELIYEAFRDFRQIIVAHSMGQDIQIFKFKESKEPSK